MTQVLHQVYLNLGSDIDPFNNLNLALCQLQIYGTVQAISLPWESLAVGSQGPNFINIAAAYQTQYDPNSLKTEIIRPIEEKLGRVRTKDKNAPRPIDIDIMLFDGAIVEPEVWRRLHLALPLADLLPDLKHPDSNLPLKEIAQRLQNEGWAQSHLQAKITLRQSIK